MTFSIVIRGINKGFTQKVIDSLRVWHNGEIILSTWGTEDITRLTGLTSFVLSKDPGPGPVQALNRQICSGFAGVSAASEDVVMVIKSDVTMHENPLRFFDDPAFSRTTDSFKIFKKKLVIGNMMSINPDRNIELSHERTFRLGDWFHIGLKEDLLKHFGIYDVIQSNPYPRHPGCEQNWLGAVIKKYYKPDLDLNCLEQYHQYSWDVILNNFRIINNMNAAKSFCLKSPWNVQPEDCPTYLSQSDYEQKYQQVFK